MDALTFIDSIIQALAWPVVALIALWWLRGPVGDLIPLLTTLKYKDWELDFGRRLQQAADDAAGLQNAPAAAGLVAASHTLADGAATPANQPQSPRAVIAQAWTGVGAALDNFAAQHKINGPAFGASDAAARANALERAGAITDQQARLIADLNSLRLTAARATAFAPTVEDARQFTQLAGKLRESLGQSKPT